jgi:hypothetical protein
MPVAERRQLDGARWSSAVICPRRAYYDHARTPLDEMPRGIEGARWRGQVIGKAVAEEIVRHWRAQGRRPRVEEAVPWPAADPVGIGHADVYLPSEARMVEIKTMSGMELRHEAALQVSGYTLNHPRAEQATVLVVDPLSGGEREYPIRVEALRSEVEEIEAKVVSGIRGGGIPARVCRHPHDEPSLICPYVSTCFQEWTPPTLPAPQMAEAFRRLAEVERLMKYAKSESETLREDRDELRRNLAPFLEPGMDYVAGGIRVRRSMVEGHERLSLSEMRKAGYEVPAELEPFVRDIVSSERWYVTEVGV